jgi:hypothetical protein
MLLNLTFTEIPFPRAELHHSRTAERWHPQQAGSRGTAPQLTGGLHFGRTGWGSSVSSGRGRHRRHPHRLSSVSAGFGSARRVWLRFHAEGWSLALAAASAGGPGPMHRSLRLTRPSTISSPIRYMLALTLTARPSTSASLRQPRARKWWSPGLRRTSGGAVAFQFHAVFRRRLSAGPIGSVP